MDQLQSSFKKEFDADKILNKELDKQYRELHQNINDFLSGKAQNEFAELFEIVQKKQSQIFNVVKAINLKVQIVRSDFLISHIHMMMNRQYTSQQRRYELIIYDHLYRYYKKKEYRKETIR